MLHFQLSLLNVPAVNRSRRYKLNAFPLSTGTVYSKRYKLIHTAFPFSRWTLGHLLKENTLRGHLLLEVKRKGQLDLGILAEAQILLGGTSNLRLGSLGNIQARCPK